MENNALIAWLQVIWPAPVFENNLNKRKQDMQISW